MQRKRLVILAAPFDQSGEPDPLAVWEPWALPITRFLKGNDKGASNALAITVDGFPRSSLLPAAPEQKHASPKASSLPRLFKATCLSLAPSRSRALKIYFPANLQLSQPLKAHHIARELVSAGAPPFHIRRLVVVNVKTGHLLRIGRGNRRTLRR